MNDCKCPIHRGTTPPTYPLGIRFTDKLSIEPIKQHIAASIYDAHHSYMPDTPAVNLCHHGILLDGCLVGAITYRHPLISSLGDYSGESIVEVARICVGVDMPNLASAAFAQSQKKFIREYTQQNGIELLITFVREDYKGSMLRAVKGLGWENDGVRETTQPGNRDEKEIHDYDKERWVRPLRTDTTQATLT